MTELLSSMTLLEIVELRPDTVEVFRQYEELTGSCLLCSNLFDSLESVASQYSLKLDDLLSRLQTSDEERMIT
jgi:hypothetical protein